VMRASGLHRHGCVCNTVACMNACMHPSLQRTRAVST
jgi:hypothetical protein